MRSDRQATQAQSRRVWQLTGDHSRKLAQKHMATVRCGAGSSQDRQAARGVPTVKDLAKRYMVEHCQALSKASSTQLNRYVIKSNFLPIFSR